MEVVQALLLGFGFGWLLHKAGLTQYARIVGVYRLRDMTVIQFMLVALVVAAVLVQGAVDLGLAKTLPVPPTFLVANAVGGVVFGVGMASAGYCTGTVVAQAGEGHLDAWTAGLSGLFVGAIAFGLLEPTLMPALTRIGSLGHVTLATLSGARPWLLLIVFGEVVALVLYGIGRREKNARARNSFASPLVGTRVAQVSRRREP